MKIRNGFVSNSSSSSFVVAFPSEPKDQEDLREMMFDSGERTISYYDYSCDVERVVDEVFRDLKKATIKDMVESVNNGWFDGRADSWDRTKNLSYAIPEEKEEIDKIWEENEKENEKIAKNIIKKFKKENKDCFFAVFEYGDDDSFHCIMEHGEIFYKLNNIQTSYH